MTDETRQLPAQTVSHGTSSLAADLAIQIADTHMRAFSIERRKALAHAIVAAISRCEADFAAQLVKQLNTSHRPEGGT